MPEAIKIGNVTIERCAALAPMASVADYAWRSICKEYGAAYVVGEMVSAKALCYGDKKSDFLLRITPEEEPMAIQLFGDDPDFMARAAELSMRFHPRIIDVNMGCPVPKVTKSGAGSSLMKTPEKAYRIVKAMTSAVDVPITVKIRKGWDEQTVNAPAFAKYMEEAGASAITVHGRTKQQMYAPPVDLDVIRAVKQAVSIPVIGNGGITDGPGAAHMYQYTGCDLVMIGQGSYGRPWVFEQVKRYLETGELLPEPSLEERMAVLLRHAARMVEDKGEAVGMREARKVAAWYIKGCRGAAAFRGECGRLASLSQLQGMLEALLREAAKFPEQEK